MDKKNVSMAIMIISLLYFIWLVVVAANETMLHANMYLSLKEWSIIGIAIYIIFLAIEGAIYLSEPKEEEREIKLISPAIKKIVCSNCKTVFTIKDTGVRPLKYTCPNCGMEGVIRGKNVKGKTRIIECEECGERFEIFDTGERPLHYECPFCHHKGVIE